MDADVDDADDSALPPPDTLCDRADPGRERLTGGHQSALRLAIASWMLAAALGCSDTFGGWHATLGGGARLAPIALALAVAVGWRSRTMAALAGIGVLVDAQAATDIGRLAAALTATLCLLIVTAPAAPWGSLDAVGRVDPGGGWVRPAWQRWLARAALAGAFAWWFALRSAAPSTAALLDTALPLFAPLALLTAASIDPRWIAPIGNDECDVVFYDGQCGLCHRTVRWLLAEDPDGVAFRFAVLGGDTWAARLPKRDRDALPDSVAVLTADGRLLTRWLAVQHLLARMGGVWRLIGALLVWLPRSLGDRAYNGVAAIRHRLFAKPKDLCPMLPPTLRARMLP